MAKKTMAKKTIEDLIREDWGESRQSTEFFASLSDDAWHGYITAMTLINYGTRYPLYPKQTYDLVCKLV